MRGTGGDSLRLLLNRALRFFGRNWSGDYDLKFDNRVTEHLVFSMAASVLLRQKSHKSCYQFTELIFVIIGEKR